MKLFRKIMCCVMLISLLAINAVAYYDLDNNYNYDSTVLTYNGKDAGCYTFYYDVGGNILLLDKADASTSTYNSMQFTSEETTLTAYIEMINDYTGNHDADSQADADETAIMCEAFAELNDRTATYCHWQSQMWVNAKSAFSKSYKLGTRD